MCGIAGFINLNKNKDKALLTSEASCMGATLVHRGPDSSGIWTDEKSGIALVHRRLAVLDLSPAGHQPMVSASGRYIIIFNGEIYNFMPLKQQFEKQGYCFKGHSDTEVLLAAIEQWGLSRTLEALNGMFAFALWDRRERLLYLARDRMGKKPIYYGLSGKNFFFASELKALRAHPDFKADIDRDALSAYMRHNYVPTPWSIYKGIGKLPPASFLCFSPQEGKVGAPQVYWSLEKVAEQGCAQPLDIGFEEAVDELDALFTEAVAQRMVSDVPLGAFLSGGIDSSLVTAVMQKQSPRPVQSFCLGFEESGYNEAPAARAIAEYLGTEHTEYYVSAEDARAVIPDMPRLFDEPFADPSQIPTYHISRLARQHVTVALSGDGGDESFAGYGRYHSAHKTGSAFYALPEFCRKMLVQALQPWPLTGRARKLRTMLEADDPAAFYRLLMSYQTAPENLVIGGVEPFCAMSSSEHIPELGHFINQMMYMDMNAYLPDDILVKVDRASMAESLEIRAPLLDYKIIEFAWRLPLYMKCKGGQGKHILKALLARYIPDPKLFERPKQGFGIPHGEWIRGPLKDWAEDLLDENSLRNQGFFDPVIIRRQWQEHLTGRQDRSYAIWGVLMFQVWYKCWHQ